MTTATVRHDIIESLRELRPQIEAYSEEAERLRHLPDGLVRLLRDAGVFGMARPVEMNGMGLDLLTTMRAVEEISTADASAGWCAAIGSGSIGTARLAGDAAAAVFKPGTYLAGVGAPNGRAVPADGGYRLTGRWQYASGCRHADWIFMGSMVMDGERPRMAPSGLPDIRMAVVPISEVEIIDTWQVSGLRGTGSHDVAVHDLFVPEERAVALALDPGAANVQFRIPMFTLFGIALVPVALGAARRAIDEVMATARGKTPMLSGSKLMDKPVFQHEMARAEGMLQAGRTYLYAAVGGLLEAASAGAEIDMAMRGRVKLACATATDFAAQATDIAYRLGGASALFETGALQRCFRDVHAVTQHFTIAASNYEVAGRVMLGLEPGTPVI